MEVIFLAYSNSQTSPLPSLQEEDTQIYRLLSARAWKQHYYIHREPFASIQSISEYLVVYRNYISYFLFSGHAGRDMLLLDDEEGRSEGITQLLKQCPKLKIVFLNGCSTEGQVQALLDAGIPVVIATSAPVGDQKAKDFSIRFFQTMAEHGTIGEAFEFASGQVLANAAIEIKRDIELANFSSQNPVWGIFHLEGKKDFLNEKLPSSPQTSISIAADYKPNDRLTYELWDILAPYSKKIQRLKILEEDGDEMEKGDKQVSIINSLPRPIGWHLRKLMAPIEEKDKGYDKLSEARLKQMVVTYETIMEFMTYIMLAQLWNAKFINRDIALPNSLKEQIKKFINLNLTEKPGYNYATINCQIAEFMTQRDIPFFVEEMKTIRTLFKHTPSFESACLFINVLRKKIHQDSVAQFEIKEFCIRGGRKPFGGSERAQLFIQIRTGLGKIH